jgi:2',3'-cyclic-nucleotide 2'-phosphodiesterase (5'-nucleotidase family)
VFAEIAKVVSPIKEITDTLAQRTHYQDIEQKIGQYDDSLRDQVESWMKTQPDYLQSAYQQVIDQGTSEQVADLVARFRKETGQAPQSAAAPKPAGAKGGTELSAPAKQAAAALEPVETKRTVIEQSDDPNDFDKAFSRFADQFNKPK